VTCMSTSDQELANAIRQANSADSEAPSFGKVWSAAEQRYQRSRRRYASLASAAAMVAAVIVVLNAGQPTVNHGEYIERAELLDSTSWAAPSDVLLPIHDFDIYRDLPALMESTKPAEGALL